MFCKNKQTTNNKKNKKHNNTKKNEIPNLPASHPFPNLPRYSVGHDGLTPWRRLTGRTCTGAVAEFGEGVLGKLALEKSLTNKTVKRGKNKLARRSIEGI